jgi:hypothetical protein
MEPLPNASTSVLATPSASKQLVREVDSEQLERMHERHQIHLAPACEGVVQDNGGKRHAQWLCDGWAAVVVDGPRLGQTWQSEFRHAN